MSSDIIQLLDSASDKVLDSVSTEYEDSFSLETFGDLAKAYWSTLDPTSNSPKKFIIARVQTSDVKQPDKAFYSYYHAFHLNKILFQTQVYLKKKLIHRLHVLNPLTNTDIIGSVQYFMIKKRDDGEPEVVVIKDEDLLKDASNQQSKVIIATASLAVKNDKSINFSVSSPQPTTPLTPDGTNSTKRLKKQPGLSINIETAKKVEDRGPVTATVRDVETGVNQNWTLTIPRVNHLDEEEPTAGTDIEKSTKLKRSKSLSPRKKNRKPTEIITDKVHIPITPITAPPGRLADTWSITMPSSGPSSSPVKNGEPSEKDTSHPTIVNSFTISRKTTAMPLSIHGSVKKNSKADTTVIPSGQVTRFAVPVSKEEMNLVVPKTTFMQRRTLSYANAVTAAGTQATIEEWMEMVKEDCQESSEKDGDFDIVKPFGSPISLGSPTKDYGRIGKIVGSPIKKSPLKIAGLGCVPEEEEEEKNLLVNLEDCWDAVLFATDTDFLESSKIRLKFKNNAINPEDAMLFKMKEFTGEDQADVDVNLGDDDLETCLDWCYPTREQLQSTNIFLRAFHRYKCFLFVALGIGGVFAFVYFTLNGSTKKTTT